MDNAFDGLNSLLKVAKERTDEPEEMSIETSKNKEKSEKKNFKETEYTRNVEELQKVQHIYNENTGRRRKTKGNGRNI